jgi:chromosome partitioning protein
MNIIAVANNKGGVGKTTVSRMLAEYFSLVKKERVLAIDMDPQANFSNRFLKMEIDPYQSEGKVPPLHPDYEIGDEDWDGRSSIADIFFGEGIFPYSTTIETLDICPSHSSKLLLAERITNNEVVEKVYDQLLKFLSLKEVQNSYDKVIIDTPPSKGPVTISVIRAATHLIIPSFMEPMAVEGVFGMLHLCKSESLRRTEDNSLNLIGVLPNSVHNRGNLHKDILQDLKNSLKDKVLDTVIMRRLIYAETDADGAVPPSIFMYPDTNVAKKEALKVCKEIEKRINTYVD